VSIRFPVALRDGARIGVTAPASGVDPDLHPRLDLALQRLRSLGFEVREGACLRSNAGAASAPPQQRAQELMGLLCSPDIDAVMPPWGGQLAIELLPLLDFDRLRALPPKWFSGFSDLSTLALPLLLRAGWASLHGPNLMELASAEPTQDRALERLSLDGTSVFEQTASRQHCRQPADWRRQPESGLKMDTPTRWRRLDGRQEALCLRGRALGGCIETLSRLAGTEFGDVPGFVHMYRQEGVLLFLEQAEMAPFEFARCLHSLRLQGWFEGLAGLLFGRFSGAGLDAAFSFEDALANALDGLACPVLFDLDLGHVPPQLCLVQGAQTELEYRDGGGCVRQWLR
jgi:muramoyltetrapeptide carboxypeptidase